MSDQGTYIWNKTIESLCQREKNSLISNVQHQIYISFILQEIWKTYPHWTKQTGSHRSKSRREKFSRYSKQSYFQKKVAGLRDNPDKQPMKPRNISVEEKLRRSLRLKNHWRECIKKGGYSKNNMLTYSADSWCILAHSWLHYSEKKEYIFMMHSYLRYCPILISSWKWFLNTYLFFNLRCKKNNSLFV